MAVGVWDGGMNFRLSSLSLLQHSTKYTLQTLIMSYIGSLIRTIERVSQDAPILLLLLLLLTSLQVQIGHSLLLSSSSSTTAPATTTNNNNNNNIQTSEIHHHHSSSSSPFTHQNSNYNHLQNQKIYLLDSGYNGGNHNNQATVVRSIQEEETTSRPAAVEKEEN
jgi:hypothetical protein